jgi:hypothetical protein
VVDLEKFLFEENAMPPQFAAPIRAILSSGALIACGPDVLAATSSPAFLAQDLARPLPFAMDAFGDIFVRHEGGVLRVNTETGEADDTWIDLECWAKDLTDDPDVVVGMRFLATWEKLNGRIPAGHRLAPRIPFVLGGPYTLDNIVSLPIDAILSFRTHLAREIYDLPDGARVLLDTAD